MQRRAQVAAEIEQLEDRGSDCRFQIQHAASLLRVLADTMQERHIGIGDSDHEPWASVEYLADQIHAHTDALGDMMEELQRLGMNVKHAYPAPAPNNGGANDAA